MKALACELPAKHGLPLGRFYGDLEDTLLVCTTEWHSPADVDRLSLIHISEPTRPY